MRVHSASAGETTGRGCGIGRDDRGNNEDFDEDTPRARNFHGNTRGRGNFGHGPYCRCHLTHPENFENTRAEDDFGNTPGQHYFEYEGAGFPPHFGETGEGHGWFERGRHARPNCFGTFPRDNTTGRNAFEMPSMDPCGRCGGMRGRGGFGPFGGMRGGGGMGHFRGGMGGRGGFGAFGGMRGRGGVGPFGGGMRGGFCGAHSRGGHGGVFGDSRFRSGFGVHGY